AGHSAGRSGAGQGGAGRRRGSGNMDKDGVEAIAHPEWTALSPADRAFMQENEGIRRVLLSVQDLHFAEFPPERQVSLLRCLRPARFTRGQVIIREGDYADAFYFIVGSPRGAAGSNDVGGGGKGG
ncbi:unnamed protein product, partial [Phaeothamnion confervicola]